MILEQCKGVHCVDLKESFRTHIYLQNFVSIPPKTSLVRFSVRFSVPAARSPRAQIPQVTSDASRRRSGSGLGVILRRRHRTLSKPKRTRRMGPSSIAPRSAKKFRPRTSDILTCVISWNSNAIMPQNVNDPWSFCEFWLNSGLISSNVQQLC